MRYIYLQGASVFEQFLIRTWQGVSMRTEKTENQNVHTLSDKAREYRYLCGLNEKKVHDILYMSGICRVNFKQQ